MITTLVAGEINSYRQLPKNFYQIQTKFRDEIRPRFGLMRAKEFIMKDAYSFDVTDEAAQVSYQKMYDAYARIFQRCGLKAVAGRSRHRRDGRQVFARIHGPRRNRRKRSRLTAKSRDYAANVEKATSQADSSCNAPTARWRLRLEKFATPGVVTIEALTKPPYNVAAHAQIKTLVYMVQSKPSPPACSAAIDQLNEAKLAAQLGTAEFPSGDRRGNFQRAWRASGQSWAVSVDSSRLSPTNASAAPAA